MKYEVKHNGETIMKCDKRISIQSFFAGEFMDLEYKRMGWQEFLEKIRKYESIKIYKNGVEI